MASFDSGTKGLVRWPGLILALIVTFLLTAVLVGAATYWVLGMRHIQVNVPSHDTNLVLPQSANVTFQLDKPIQLRAEQVLNTKADISGSLNATLDKDIETTFEVRDEAEVKYQLKYRDNVAVASDVVVEGTEVVLKMGEREMRATLTGLFNISGEIPVQFEKDVAKSVSVHVRAPAKIALGEQFSLPVNSKIDVQIPIAADLSVAGDTREGEVSFAAEPVPASLQDLSLQVPLQSITVQGTQ